MVDPNYRKLVAYRKGALGDLIMIASCLYHLKDSYDHISLHCSHFARDIVGSFIEKYLVKDVQIFGDPPQPPPGITLLNSSNTLGIHPNGYPMSEGYPKVKMKHHLLYYFAKELGTEYPLKSIVLDPPPIPDKIQMVSYVTIHNKAGWSMYKEWGGWQEIIDMLKKSYPTLGVYQIGGPNDPQFNNIDGSFCGDSFDDNIAAQAGAQAHLGIDSVFNHTTNFEWRGRGKTPAVILWGSTQREAAGYNHNLNLSLGLPCQPCFIEDPYQTGSTTDLPCSNPPGQTFEEPRHACMAGLSIQNVFDSVVQILKRKQSNGNI